MDPQPEPVSYICGGKNFTLWNGEYIKARRCYSVQRVRLPYSLQEAYSSKYVFILFILLFPSCFLCGLVLVRLSF
ncbi:hypothetical protein NC652_028416 [Populus alba x Populus x berolinensis]|nr:hypothetical protein NC652_028416 [Populus alba x Populus x berolinensis]